MTRPLGRDVPVSVGNLHRGLDQILHEVVNLGKLAPKFRGVLSEGVYLPLYLRGPSDLDVHLSAHLAELIVDNRQNVGA